MKILISLLFFLSLSFAQQKWVRTYGGTNLDEAHMVQQTSDGGYIVAGYTISFGAGSYDVYLIKTNASGDTLWTRTYGGTNEDRGYSVQQTSDGGYIIAGFTYSFGVGGCDVYLIKTNASGDTLWTRTYGGSINEEGWSVKQTSDGGYIVAGLTSSFGTGSVDVYLIKTNASGDTLWTRLYGGMGLDWGRSVQQTSDSGYIVAGFTSSFGAGSYDYYLIKTNASGDTLWTRTYGGTNIDWSFGVQQTSNGGYIVVGESISFGSGWCVYLIKTNASGDTLWTKLYVEYDGGRSVQQTSDGGYIIAGSTTSHGAGGYDIFLIKTNASGDTLWTRTYGGSNNDEGWFVQQTLNGGYIITGATNSFGAGNWDVYLIKTDADGIVAVEERQNRTQNLEARLKVVPNPFTLFTKIPGYEKEDFTLSDVTGRSVGIYKGMKIGDNLRAGVYFVISQNKNINPIRIVKIR